MTTYQPLAVTADLEATPLYDVVRRYSSGNIDTLMVAASYAIEDLCGCRLAPFSGLTESSRATATDIDESWDVGSAPLDTAGALAQSRAQSLGASQLVRQCWVRNRPPTRPDLWTGAVSSISILRAVSGSQVIGPSSIGGAIQFEPDIGHIRFYYGSFIPVGSTLLVTYSGGYSTVPPSLVRATCYEAAKMAFLELDPEARPDMDLAELDKMIETLCSAYLLEGDD